MRKLLAIAAFVAASIGMMAGDSTTPSTAPTTPPVGPPPGGLPPVGPGLGGLFVHRPDVSNLPADLQALIQQFKADRDALMASRKALFDSLKGLTRDEVKAAIQAWEAQNKDSLTTERDLAKQIRDQLETLRKEHQHLTPPGG